MTKIPRWRLENAAAGRLARAVREFAGRPAPAAPRRLLPDALDRVASPAFLEQIRETAAFEELVDTRRLLEETTEQLNSLLAASAGLRGELAQLYRQLARSTTLAGSVPAEGLPVAAIHVVIPQEGDAVVRHLPHLTAAEVWRLVEAAAVEYGRRHFPADHHPQPGDVVTDEPPVGSIVQDRDGAQFKRLADSPGWSCIKEGSATYPVESDDGLFPELVEWYGPLTLVRWGPA